MNPIIQVELKHVSVTPPILKEGKERQPIIKDVSLVIHKGEWISLLGCNGSGKSTLAKVAAGFRIAGVSGQVARNIHTSAKGKPIPIVMQQPEAAMIGATPWEDIILMLEQNEQEASTILTEAEDALRRVGMGARLHQSIGTLSGGQKQLVAIAGCLALQSPMLVLDEVTAMLDPEAAIAVLEQARSLQQNGITVIWITQKLDELRPNDRIIAMDAGSIVYDGGSEAWLAQSAADLKDNEHNQLHMESSHDVKDDWNLSKVSVLSDGTTNKQLLDDVNVSFKAGQITLLIGRNGAGKSTLLETMAGVRPVQAGNISLGADSLWENHKRRKKINRKVLLKLGISMQNAESQWFASSVREELHYSLKPYRLDAISIDKRIEHALTKAGLPEELLERDPWTLSGGQQRRLSLACLLACEPDWLLLDEPTAGLDAGGIRSLCAALDAHRAAGRGAVVATHDLDALLPLADAVVVVSGGKVSAAEEHPHSSNNKPSQSQAEKQKSDVANKRLRSDYFDPRAIILAYLFVATSIIAQKTALEFLIAALTTFVLVFPFRTLIWPWKRVIRAYVIMIIIFCFVAGIGISPLSFEWAKVWPVSIKFGKLLLIMLLGMPMLQLMTPMRLQRAIEQTFGKLERIKLPIHSFALIVTLIFRFIPLLTGEWERFAKLAHARGKAVTPLKTVPIKSMISILIPYVRSILRLAEQMADALEARGFGYAKRKPTYGFRLRFGKPDAGLIGIAMAAGLSLFVVAFLL